MNVQPEAPDHPKFVLLKELVGPLAAEFLWRLWGHCAQNKRGPVWVKPQASARYVEIVCRWPGEPGKLFAALVECGWLHDTEQAVIIHDWELYNSKMVTAWDNGQSGGRAPLQRAKTTHRSQPGNPTSNSVPPTDNPKPVSVPNPETQSEFRSHLDRIGLDRLGTRRGGGSPAGEESEEAVIPTAAEVVTYGSMSAAIPEDYCLDYHERKSIARTWLNHHQALVDWRREILSWWTKRKATWGQKPGGPARGAVSELQAIKDELDWQPDSTERARLKKRRDELEGGKS